MNVLDLSGAGHGNDSSVRAAGGGVVELGLDTLDEEGGGRGCLASKAHEL